MICVYVSKETIAQFKRMGIKDRDIATYGMKPSLPSRDKSTLRTLAQMQKPLDEPIPMSDTQPQSSNPELEENMLSNDELLDGAAWEEHVEEFCARLFGRKYEKQQALSTESQQSSGKAGNLAPKVKNRPQKTKDSRSKQEATVEDPIQKRYNDNINKIMRENEIAAKIRDKIIKEQEKEKQRENRKRLKANKLNEKQRLKQEKTSKKNSDNVYSPPKNKFAITDEDLARASKQSRKGRRK